MHLQLKSSLVFLSIFCLFSCSVSTEISTTHEEDGLISEIEAIANTNNFNGVILITQGNKVITEIARGKSDLSAKNALIPTDQFVIGSISKQITAVLILREMEKGNLALSDKIGKFLPEIKQEWAQNVSIHHLLSHTHGIASLDKPAEFSPGSQFQYSQIGYDLLAQIITVVSNKSFEDAAMELFETKGMNQTFHPDRKGYTRLVKGYEELEDLSLEYQTTSLSNFAAAGSFISTAHDLWLWNQLLYSGQLVHLETLELMRTKQAVREHPIFSQVNYGYGLLFMENEANIEIGALGYAPGFASACYYYPKTDMHVVVLSNIARDLNEFKLTFETHTSIMRLVKEISL